MEKENRLGYESIPRLIMKMSVPMMISMLVMALYNIVDSIFVSRISEDALTAVSIVFPYQMLYFCFAIGTAIGVNSLVARRLGEKRQQDANIAAGNGQFLALCTTIFFTLLFGFFTEELLSLLTRDPVLLPLATDYLWICGIANVFVMFSAMNEKTLQGTGNSIYTMVTQLSGAVFNLIFDPILIFGLYGFPMLGVKGAAIATVGGQCLSMLVSAYFLHFKSDVVKIRFKDCLPRWQVIKDIYVVGIPSIVMQAMGSILSFGLNKILIGISSTAVSVLGVYNKLQSFVFMPIFGLNSGVLPILAYNYGAKNKQRFMYALKLSTGLALGIMFLGLALFQFFPDALLSLFNPTENMLDIGRRALRTISLCFPLAGAGIMLSTVFPATAKAIYSLLSSLMRQLIVLLPAAYLLASTFGLDAFWYAFLIAELISLATTLVFFTLTYRKTLKNLGLPPEDVA